MALKTLIVISENCVRCGGAAGPEVVPGDTVKLWLDQESIPAFPEWIEGTVILVEPQTVSSTSPKDYTIQYDSDDLEGAAAAIRDCDVLTVTCESCCGIINEYLTLLAGLNIPHVQLSYKWNPDGTLTLEAQAYSTQIAGNPGVPVTITSYVFTDPDSVEIPEDVDPDSRTVTVSDPVGGDWPGGYYTVTVTDSEGLINSATVWVAPRIRFRTEIVTVPATNYQGQVNLGAGETVVSAMPMRSGEGVTVFGLAEGDESIVEVSAPVINDLNLMVLIHLP